MTIEEKVEKLPSILEEMENYLENGIIFEIDKGKIEIIYEYILTLNDMVTNRISIIDNLMKYITKNVKNINKKELEEILKGGK